LSGCRPACVLAQAGVGAAIGIAYSRGHLPSIIITLMFVAALFGLALVTRTARTPRG
jgi:ribose/xylose/arabinose/galactoside ABC-type transport system permease subunit